MNRKSLTIDFTMCNAEREQRNPTDPNLYPVNSPEWLKAQEAHGLKVRSYEEIVARNQQRQETQIGRPRMDKRLRAKNRGICLRDSEFERIKNFGGPGRSPTEGIRFFLRLDEQGFFDQLRQPRRPKHKILPMESKLTKIDPTTGKRYDGTPLSRNLQRRTPIHPPILDNATEDDYE